MWLGVTTIPPGIEALRQMEQWKERALEAEQELNNATLECNSQVNKYEVKAFPIIDLGCDMGVGFSVGHAAGDVVLGLNCGGLCVIRSFVRHVLVGSVYVHLLAMPISLQSPSPFLLMQRIRSF